MSAKSEDMREPDREVWPVIAVICMVGAFALVIGYTYPALSFALDAAGVSKTVIGLQTAMTGAGIVAGSLLTPVVALRIGAWRLGVANGFATIFILAGFGFSEPDWTWFPMRFALGVAICTLFVLGETWLNELAPPRLRGRIVAAYTTAIAGLFGTGPLLIPVIGYSGATPFAVICVLVGIMLLPLWTLRGRVSPIEDSDTGAMLAVVRIIPVLIFAVAVFGMFDGAVMGLWVVYGIELGYPERIASWTLSASILGNLFLQLPIGWLADRMSRKALLVICSGAGAVGALLLPFLELGAPLVWPVLMLWGGLCFGTYTIALTLVGEHLKGAQLYAANAAFGLMWGIGAIAGGSIAGGLMDAAGPYSLPGFIAVIFSLLTLFALTVAPVRR